MATPFSIGQYKNTQCLLCHKLWVFIKMNEDSLYAATYNGKEYASKEKIGQHY
jgi:hypothetical protein